MIHNTVIEGQLRWHLLYEQNCLSGDTVQIVIAFDPDCLIQMRQHLIVALNNEHIGEFRVMLPNEKEAIKNSI